MIAASIMSFLLIGVRVEVPRLISETDIGRSMLSRQTTLAISTLSYMSNEKIEQRRETADRLAREFNADGIVYENVKFCDFWGFERALASHIQFEEYGHPVLTIDRPYNAKTSGQLRTRFQAFVESLEIKRIQQGKEVK